MRSTALLLLTVLLLGSGGAAAFSDQEWRFKVYLDQKEIGYHRFELRHQSAGYELLSEAKFNIRFLFINAYSYSHQSSERWSGGCVSAINARTDDNGSAFHVDGNLEGGLMLLSTQDGKEELAGCVRTFAYWNEQLLDAPRLLNSQTGEYVDVKMEVLGEDVIEVRGAQLSARHYRLHLEDAPAIDLWYAEDGQWLALESATERGGRLRYTLS